MSVTTTSIGIIGLGNIGRLHAERFLALGASIAGMDIDDEARQQFVDRYDAPVFDDHYDLFATVDAVVIAVPNAYHERYAINALEAGLDVFLEKPMADSWAGARRIADAAERASGVCTVGFHNRYRAVVDRFERLREEGLFGDLTHVRANYVRRSGVPEHGSWFTRADLAGGGALIDIGVHAIDLALHLLGYPRIETVVGTTRRSSDAEFDVEDAASALIRCAGGKTIALEVAWQTTGPEDKSFVIEGTEGGGRLIPGDERLETFDGGTRTTVDVDRVDPYEQQARSFLRTIETGADSRRTTVDEALTVQWLIDKIYRARFDTGYVTDSRIEATRPWAPSKIGQHE